MYVYSPAVFNLLFMAFCVELQIASKKTRSLQNIQLELDCFRIILLLAATISIVGEHETEPAEESAFSRAYVRLKINKTTGCSN